MLPFPVTLLLLVFQQLQAVAQLCSSFSCNQHKSDPIQFPFWVPNNQSYRCGYPGFELSCNSHGQTLLPLSSHHHLIIQRMSYLEQQIWVSDPNRCIPKRVLDLSIRKSPLFKFGSFEWPYSFFNCSGVNNTKLNPKKLPGGVSVVSCMDVGNHTVAVAADGYEEELLEKGKEWKCEMMKRLNVAFWWEGMEYASPYPRDMSDVLVQLSWENPSCVDCMNHGGSCGLVSDSGLEIGCYLPSSFAFPRSAKVGLILGAGIPLLLCIIGLTLYISGRVRTLNPNRSYTNTESSPSISPQPIILRSGLDAPTIESYPKTILGESKRLPKSSDNMCPICLSEYQPKEALRSIPDCNHYFHAECIDEWLRMNATCPLCRNSPQPAFEPAVR